MLELLPPLNDHNLPWMDTIHPIVVHFVIAMALIGFVFDLIGVLWRRPALFEASFWNLLFATGAIFVAIIFGQVEAGLASPYGAARNILDIHTTIGWSLVGVLSLLTALWVLHPAAFLQSSLPQLSALGDLTVAVAPALMAASFSLLTTVGTEVLRSSDVTVQVLANLITISGQLYVAILIGLILGRVHHRAVI